MRLEPKLAAFVAVLQFSFTDQSRLKDLLQYANGVVCMGDESAIAAVKQMTPRMCDLLIGPKISFAYILQLAFDDAALITSNAEDVLTI